MKRGDSRRREVALNHNQFRRMRYENDEGENEL